MARNELNEIDHILIDRLNKLEVKMNPAHWQKISDHLKYAKVHDVEIRTEPPADSAFRFPKNVREYVKWISGFSMIGLTISILIAYYMNMSKPEQKLPVAPPEKNTIQEAFEAPNEESVQMDSSSELKENLKMHNDLPLLKSDESSRLSGSDSIAKEIKQEKSDSLDNFIFW